MFVIFYLFSNCESLSPSCAEPCACLVCVWTELISYAPWMGQQEVLEIRTRGELVTSSSGKGFPFLSQVEVKVHFYALLSGSNGPTTTVTGTGASLLNVHVHGLCHCGRTGIFSPNILPSLLLLELVWILYLFLTLNDFDIHFFLYQKI